MPYAYLKTYLMDYHFENGFPFVFKYIIYNNYTYRYYYTIFHATGNSKWMCSRYLYIILYNNNYTHKQFNILKAHNYLNACILHTNTFLIKFLYGRYRSELYFLIKFSIPYSCKYVIFKLSQSI